MPKNPQVSRVYSAHEKAFLGGQAAIMTAGKVKEEATKNHLIKRAFTNPSTVSIFSVFILPAEEICSGLA